MTTAAGAPADPLVARPIASAPANDSVETAVRLWDNANIVESFPDLTLPLTFSVASEAYAIVYRQACLALGVPRRVVETESALFEQMLGLLQGRVYYNLATWYRVLALLPGFRLNAGFLEAMMGARRPGAEPSDRSTPVASRAARVLETAGSIVRLSYRFVRIGGDVARFEATTRRLLDDRRDAPEVSGTRELVASFDRFRELALQNWRTPIINDVFLMITNGLLRRVADRWLGPDGQGLVTAALGHGSVTSARPGAELLRIASVIRDREGLRGKVLAAPPQMIRTALDANPDDRDIGAMIDDYLERWGSRAPRELQLERLTYRDDPVPLLRALQALVAGPPGAREDAAGAAISTIDTRLRRQRLGVLRRAVFAPLLRATKRHIRWREEMRLIRGEVFDVGRRIFGRLGSTLSEQGVLEAPTDVHYLTIDELREIVRGTAVDGDARRLVQLRRGRYATFRSLPRLPSRFETIGPATELPTLVVASGERDLGAAARVWNGIGAAHGRVAGPCLVIEDPATAEIRPGRIIAARSTDPGWLPILVSAAGLVVEQGSLLSHSAIVARELGIPTVVGLAGLLDVLRTGDIVELDGATGRVAIVSAGAGDTA